MQTRKSGVISQLQIKKIKQNWTYRDLCCSCAIQNVYKRSEIW